jgi:hypothetical protein
MMDNTDKNRQMVIYALAIIASVILAVTKIIDGKTAFAGITGIVTYTMGRFTPYQEVKK